MGRKANRNKSAHCSRHHLGQRILAMMLTLVMVLALSGIQVMADNDDNSDTNSNSDVVDDVGADNNSSDVDNNENQDVDIDDDIDDDTDDNDIDIDSVGIPVAASDEFDDDVVGFPVAVSDDDDTNEKNIAGYIETKSTIEFFVDGQWWTIEKLNAANKKVSVGADVKVNLYFSEIDGIPAGCILYYQLPEDTVTIDQPVNNSELLDGKFGDNIGTFSIGTDGRITVQISSTYFNKYKQPTGLLNLYEFNISFSGSLSENLGQDSSKNDNVIKFVDSSEGNLISFTIPFDYANEKGKIVVDKTGTPDLVNKTVHYVVTVTAPSENTITSQGVTVTDTFTSGGRFIELYEKDKKNNIYVKYRNATAKQTAGSSSLSPTFDDTTGVLTIGDMEPGDVVTLEYDVKLEKDFYEGANTDLANYVAAVYNGTGKAMDDDTQKAPGTVIVNKAPGDANGNNDTMQTDENGKSYLVYTVKVTAYNGDVQNVSVVDTFTQNAGAVASYAYDTPSQGSVTTVDKSDSANASLTWAVGDLANDASATLTYRAYLDADAWNKSSSSSNDAITNKLILVNTATAMIGDTAVDKDTTAKEVDKILVKKSSKVTKGSSIITYTVYANSYPSTDKVVSITDEITSTGTATYSENLTLKVKKYDSTGTETSTEYTVPFEKVKVSDKKFTIDLKSVPLADGSSVDLHGPYYYEVTYTVDAGSSLSVANGAGIGVKDGDKVYNYTHTVSTKNENSAFSTNKKIIDADMANGTITFKVTLNNTSTTSAATLPEGTVFYDEVNNDDRYSRFWWFTADEVAQTKVMVGNTDITDKVTIIPGGQYIDGRVNNGTEYPGKYKKGSGYYIGFRIVFNSPIYDISSDTPVTITYKIHFNQYGDQSETNKSPSSYGAWMHNKVKWNISGEDLKLNDYSLSYTANWPIEKTGKSYDKDTDTVTWSIEANRQGNINGEATITETIPAGQTYVADSIKVTAADKNDYDTTDYDALSKSIIDSVEVNEPDDPDKEPTVVTIHLKNLVGYVYNQDRYRNADGTLNNAGIDLIKGGSWASRGRVTLTLQTKLTDKAKMALNENTELTNTAVINADGLKKDYYTSTGTVKPGISAIAKSMASQEAPAYVKFVLDINKDALNLDPSKDTVTVDDVMGEGMSLAPDRADYFTVYDVTNDKELTAGGTDGYTLEIGEKSNTFKLTVPDSTYIKVTYWAKFEGAAGTESSYTNTANYYYEGVDVSNDGGQWKNSLKVQFADASAWTSPYIKVYKYDQSGQALANVTFELYKVTVNGDGTVTLGDLVDTKTTGADGKIDFGYTKAGNGTTYHLDHETLYCIVETSAPAGYAKADPYYFELPDIYDHSGDTPVVDTEKQAAHVATHPTTITVNDKMPGETIGIINTLSVPSYSIPLDKTINGSHTDSGVNFTFTLKPLSGTAYTDSTVKTQLETSGITVTNDGSGAVEFDKLYFAAAGTYTFSLTENDTTANGFTKDSTEYKVEIVVDIGSDNTLYIKSAKYYVGSTLKGDLLNGDVPTFDNTFSLNGSFTLTAKKEITNWPEGTDMPEFEFQVYRNNKVITTAKNTADGTITFNVPITHEDLGTDQRYVIKEVSGDDDRFVYDTSSVVASVDIVLDENGGLTGKNITYKTNNGTFTNEYNASGSLTLKGWKSLYLKSDRTNSITVKAKQFNFTVKEGNDVVSTGTTKSGGEITFSAINYVAAQKGYHYYTITEDRGTELFQNYDASPIYVIVNVHDAVEGGVSGNGKLTADVVYADKTYKTVDQLEKNENEDENQMLNILFINTCNFVVPTGINLSTLPFVLTLGGALCLGGVALALCIRKRRHIQQH